MYSVEWSCFHGAVWTHVSESEFMNIWFINFQSYERMFIISIHKQKSLKSLSSLQIIYLHAYFEKRELIHKLWFTRTTWIYGCEIGIT